MPEPSLRNIYRQNDELKERLPLFPDMKNRERSLFKEEVHSLITEARQCEREIESQSTKSQLQNIIITWIDVLTFIENIPVRALKVLSTSRKISPESGTIKAEKHLTITPTSDEWVPLARSVSQPLNPHKVDRNSLPSVPHDPELRAIYDKYYGVVPSEGDTK